MSVGGLALVQSLGLLGVRLNFPGDRAPWQPQSPFLILPFKIKLPRKGICLNPSKICCNSLGIRETRTLAPNPASILELPRSGKTLHRTSPCGTFRGLGTATPAIGMQF